MLQERAGKQETEIQQLKQEVPEREQQEVQMKTLHQELLRERSKQEIEIWQLKQEVEAGRKKEENLFHASKEEKKKQEVQIKTLQQELLKEQQEVLEVRRKQENLGTQLEEERGSHQETGQWWNSPVFVYAGDFIVIVFVV